MNILPASAFVEVTDRNFCADHGALKGGADAIAVSLYRSNFLRGGRIYNAWEYAQPNRAGIETGVDRMPIDFDRYRVASRPVRQIDLADGNLNGSRLGLGTARKSCNLGADCKANHDERCFMSNHGAILCAVSSFYQQSRRKRSCRQRQS
ncbi:hypothetical protein ASF09_04290 [Sphingomonas sp. Leaf242]|nr:hypothetical protein ASF09_04290 [Sphingomonas sp. Leaf242]